MLSVDNTKVAHDSWTPFTKDIGIKRSRDRFAIAPRLGLNNKASADHYLLDSKNTTLSHDPSRPTLPADNSTKVKAKSNTQHEKKKSNDLHLLPYYWKRSETFVDDLRPAEDRTYKNTYTSGKPLNLKVEVDTPLLRQKTEARMSLKTVVKSDDASDSHRLPPEVVSRIYNQLHDTSQDGFPDAAYTPCNGAPELYYNPVLAFSSTLWPAKDKRSMYVVKHMKRAAPRHKTRSLPTILPFYHIQLVQAASKVISNGFVAPPVLTPPLEPEVIPKLSPDESKTSKHRQPSGQLIKGRRTSAVKTRTKDDLEDISECLTSKVYKSAEAYNKHLQTRMKARKERVSALGVRGGGKSKADQSRLPVHVRAKTEVVPQTDNVADDENLPKNFITAVNVSKRSAWS